MSCWTLLFWNGRKHSPRVNIDMWEYVGTLLHFKVKAVQHEVASQGISTQKIEFKAQLTSGKDQGKCVLPFRRNCSCLFSFTSCHSVQYCIVTGFTLIFTRWFRRKECAKLSKIILLHDNTCPHIADLTKMTMTSVGWKIVNHPPFSFDIAPQWFLFLYTIEGAPRRIDILIWWWIQTWCRELASQNIFYAAGVTNLPGRWKKYVSMKRDHLEMEWEFDDSGMYILVVKL
jgi:hypothetical protein